MQLSHNTSLELTGESRAATDRPQLILCFTAVAQFNVILSLAAGKVRIVRSMKDRLKKVVGYFAIQTGTMNIVCDGDACVIAGSHKALHKYISKLIGDNPGNYSIKKTRYGEILRGMRMGGVYTFDNKAYNKFLPLAKADGMPSVEFKIEDDPMLSCK